MMDVPNETSAAKQTSSKNRLSRMATLATAFRNNASDGHALQNAQQISSDSDAPSHIMSSKVGEKFYKLCYADLWVDSDFPWIEWMDTPEANLLFADRVALQMASEVQISQMITAIIRGDRFSDGTLERAYDTGLIPSLFQRVKVLAGMQAVAKSERKISKNNISIEHLQIACRQAEELTSVGISENFAIRTVELFIDVYAKLHNGGSATPHHVNQVDLWSLAALKIKSPETVANARNYFRVEHGTPQRAFARETLKLYHANNLSANTLNDLVISYWKLAVITISEDIKLNELARSKMYETPEARWKDAGINFPF